MTLYKNIGLALLVNIYFIVLCLCFSHLRYGAIDDYFMAGLLSGIYGNDYNVHLVFVNAIYGYVLLPLYHLFPKISWYYIGELASIFISLTLIVYFIICKIGHKWGVLLGLALVSLCAKDFYVVLQFTQCAAALSAAGMFVILSTIDSFQRFSKTTIISIIIGILLLWWGSLMRWDAFLMGIPFFIAAMYFKTKQLKHVWSPILITLLITFVGAYSFHHFNTTLYQTPIYQQFVDFQPFRVLLGDGAFYNEQAVYEDLQELDSNSKDFDLLKKWFFYDNEIFTSEKTQTITKLIDKYSFKPSFGALPVLLLQELSKIARFPFFIAWFLFGLALVISTRKKTVVLWISLFIFLAALSYLLSLNRVVYRVQTGLLFYAAIMVSAFWDNMPKISSKVFYSVVILFLIVSGLFYYNSKNIYRSPNNGDFAEMTTVLAGNGYKELFQFMEAKPDSVLFVTPMSTYMKFSDYRLPPYLNEAKGSWQRIVPTGYWTPYYPDVEKSFRERGMTNPMKDVVKDNVLYISDIKRGVLLVDFLKEHYFDSVRVDTVERFGDVSVLKYSVIEEKP